MRPVLLSGCGRATTAEEARFRIDAPIPDRNGTRVIALDDAAAAVVQRLLHRRHATTHLLAVAGRSVSTDGEPALYRLDGPRADLATELAGAELAVMVATADADRVAADIIASSCSSRGITTAAVILKDERPYGPTLSALRRHARVLMVSHDGSDVAEVLSALRA